MYNYSIKTTYLDIDDKKQDTQYRKEFLDTFNLEQFDNESITTTTDYLFNKYKNNKQISSLIQFHRNNNMYALSDNMAFMLFFSFENFYYFHKALQLLNQNKIIDDKLIQNLQKK